MQEKPMRGESAKQVAIARRVIESGRCSALKGETPETTIAAMLAVGSKPRGPFRRVDNGTYALYGTQAKPAAAKRSAAKPSAPPAASKSPERTANAANATDNVA